MPKKWPNGQVISFLENNLTSQMATLIKNCLVAFVRVTEINRKIECAVVVLPVC
jgi:hypothetical protein